MLHKGDTFKAKKLQSPELTEEEWAKITAALAYHYEATGNDKEHEANMALVHKINESLF